jgi:hypothetical protein
MIKRATRLARRRSVMRHERAVRFAWFLNHAAKIEYERYNRWEHRRMGLKLLQDFS